MPNIPELKVGNTIYDLHDKRVDDLKSELGKTLKLADLTYQRGYYREQDGAHVNAGTFICSVDYVDTSENKLLEIYNGVETATAIFLTKYNGDTFVSNNTFTGEENMKYIRYVVPNNITKVYVNILSSGAQIQPASASNTVVVTKALEDDLYELRKQMVSRFSGKKVSIIGDSIDTFDQIGYKLDGYNMYYPALGVTDVDMTWWKKVIDNSGMELDVNASWSGSCVTNARYDQTYNGRHYPDFYDRVSLLGNPDIIFVTLGTNDSSDNVPLGEYDFDTTYTDLSESTFRTAYIKGIKALRALYPNATIICITEKMESGYKGSIRHIARKLGAQYIDVSEYTGQSDVHPGEKGMREIASNALSKFCENESTGYETDYTKIRWIQGYINGSTGAYVYTAKHIQTKDFIRINSGDSVEIHIIPQQSNYSFYVVGYDPDMNFIGLLIESTKGFQLSDFDGFIKIVIYNNEATISTTEWDDIISIRSAIDIDKKIISEFSDNSRDYISQHDYFEVAYDHYDIVWHEGAYLNENGQLNHNKYAALTGMLRVEPGAYYQMNYTIDPKKDGRISYFDEDYNYLGNDFFYYSKTLFKIPESCHFVRINANVAIIKNLTFIRASRLEDTRYNRGDTRIFIGRWYTGTYIGINDGGKAQYLNDGAMVSDFIKVESGKKYKIIPSSPMFSGDFVVTEYDAGKSIVSSGGTGDKTRSYFVTSSATAYIRINSAFNKYNKPASCYIEKVYSKETESINVTWKGGYYDGDTGSYHTTSKFACTTQAIDTSELKTIDVYKNSTIVLDSIFFSLWNNDGFVRNVSYNYNLPHIRYQIPSEVVSVQINVMNSAGVSVSDIASGITVCQSNDCEKEHFNVVDYVESNRSDTNYLVNSSSRSNILPIGLDYDPDTMNVAFTASDVSESIVSRGLDAPCVFWDSIMMRWGMTFTGYREDSVSEYGSIYAAHSDDLVNWVQDGVIIERNLSDTHAPDYGTVGGSYVFIENDKYYVYYNGGSVRGFEAGHYTICLATGTDLAHLTKHPENPLVIGVDDGNWYGNDKVYRPSVVQWGDGKYYMFMNARCTVHTVSGQWHEYIGFATSKDLVHWTMQGQILDDMPERSYDHYVTGDPCFYDVGDGYIYATLFTCFNETGIDWHKTGVGIMRTPKKQFPYGWKMVRNTITGHPKNKSFVVYKDNVQYAFMVDTDPAIYYRTATK